MKVSACMIVKNEERTIGKCLSSICHSVDEIVVVDTGSLDHTITVARQYGAKIFQYPWKSDFALSEAKGDWVVFFDADEYLIRQ